MDTYRILLTIQYLSVALMLFMCAYITKRWKKPLHGWLFFYCVAALINNAGYLAIMQARSEEAAVIALQFSYAGRVWIPFSLFRFVLLLCKRKRRPWLYNTLALIHTATYFMVLFLPYNKLYYSSYSFVNEGLFPHLVHGNGIWHHLHDILIGSYIVIGLANLFILLRRQNHARRRRQLIYIVIAVFTDCIFFVLQMLKIVPGYDITTVGYTLATIFLFLALFRYDMPGTEELARDFVIDGVAEGVVVVDEDGMVVDFNRKARELLPELEVRPQEVPGKLSRLIEENRVLESGGRKYTPKENQLTVDLSVAGKVYMLSDDTEHYRHAEELTREMMLALSKTVDAKDHYTNGHSLRVAQYASEIARRMGKNTEEQEKIYEMGLLHDIGKIGVGEDILNKTSRLTDEEFAKIKEHTVIGCSILRQINVMPELAVGARSHHERFDGRGYPDGLKGKEIPEPARIICAADCYDAMTSTRTYSVPKAQAAVRAEFERCSGTQFDPDIAKIMIAMIDDDKDYTMHE